MPPGRRIPPPSPPVQALLLKHLGAMRADYVRDFMREHELAGRSNTKGVLLDKVKNALRDQVVGWRALIAFLDRHEPNGRQRVQMLKAPASRRQQYSADALKATLEQAGTGRLWNARVPVAAPEELRLSSVRADGHKVAVVAIGRRTYRQRVPELEDDVDLPRADLEVELYEQVEVRAWIRAELDTRTGALNLRAAALPREGVQKQLFKDFDALIAPWFPRDLFVPLDLRKAIKALHDDECAGLPCEARVQAVGYDDASGRKTTLRSASANQSLNGAPAALQQAIDAVRASGEGADGNFYFLPTSQGGPPNVPIGDEPIRVILRAAAGRVDFTKPLERAELHHVLQRVRVLAS